MVRYYFVKRGFVMAPIDVVWTEIMDIKSYPIWWFNVKSAEIKGTESKLGVGSTIDFELKSVLPYTFQYTIEIKEFKKPYLVKVKSFGDLMGSGKLILKQKNDGTALKCYWDVKSSSWIVNLVSKLYFVKSLLKNNHERVIDKAFSILKARIEYCMEDLVKIKM